VTIFQSLIFINDDGDYISVIKVAFEKEFASEKNN